MTPFDSHFSPTATSCRLALLEMSRFTVINLLAHLLEQSITEGAEWNLSGDCTFTTCVSLGAHKHTM